MRFRHVFVGIGSLLVFIILMLADPDTGLLKGLPFGSGIISTLLILIISVFYIGVLHFGRKALLDYIDLEEYFKKALLTPEGAGLAIIGAAIFSASVALVILAATK